MDYEKEYGRCRKKIKDQQTEIAKLHEELRGMRQVLKANEAIITAILVQVGATKDEPLDVPQDIINKALDGGYRVMSCYEQETMVHKVFCEEPENGT